MVDFELLKLLILSIMPAFEARAAIAYAMIFLSMENVFLFIFLTIITIIVGIFVYYFLNIFETWVRETNGPVRRILRKIYEVYIDHVRLKARKYVEKYGFIGLILFIAVPLPGSGVWTGALVANIFGIRFRKAIIAIIVGAFLASAITCILVYLGINIYKYVIP